jgi:hypothetical protein
LAPIAILGGNTPIASWCDPGKVNVKNIDFGVWVGAARNESVGEGKEEDEIW